jgi:hypothetical protein
VERCEQVWADVINGRGESMSRTLNALREAGFNAGVERLHSVCGPGRKLNWEKYARDTFLAQTKGIPNHKLLTM